MRWWRIDLKKKIEPLYGVTMHERTVGKPLAELGYVRLSTRPQHPASNPLRRRLLETFARTVGESLSAHAHGKPLEVWLQDGARVGQQGTLTRAWAKKGSRPRAPALANRIFETCDQIVEACCKAWSLFAGDPAVVTSITSREGAKVSI